MSENEPPESVRKIAQDLTDVMDEDLSRRLQSVNPRTRDEAVAEMTSLTPHLVDLLRLLTPQERLEWLRRRTELLIHMTPTGLERAALTEANIRLMVAQEPETVGAS